jgi:SAM-dependent methyltransferase
LPHWEAISVLLTDANRQAQSTWNNLACGAPADGNGPAIGTAAFFDEMARRRYVVHEPWVPSALDFPSMRGKRVLEIGHGMGCDLAHAAMAGAIVHGVDITQNHHDIAKNHFAAKGLTADLRLAAAGNLPFETASMDVVYSLGVLHHTDDTIRCIGEVYRVLKPGGVFIMSLYHFWSLSHLVFVLRGLGNGDLRRVGYRGVLSKIEAGADGTHIRPLVKLYTPRAVRVMLSDFADVSIAVRGLPYDRIPLVGPLLPAAVGRSLERRWGWYVVAKATR